VGHLRQGCRVDRVVLADQERQAIHLCLGCLVVPLDQGCRVVLAGLARQLCLVGKACTAEA
jgi:hypothetical protein